MAMATLPESFLSTNYIKHAALKTLPNKYASFIPDYVWKELEFTIRSGLAPKGTLAAFDHTDHIGLTVPNAGSCYLQDHMVHQLAAKVKANVLILDPQDFIFLAQRSFSRDVAELMPLLSSNAQERKKLLALSQEYEDDNMQDADDSDVGYLGHDTIDIIKQQQEDKDQDDIEEYDEDNFDEDDDETDEQEVKVKLHFVPFGQPNDPDKVIQVQRSKRDKEAEKAIKQLSRKYAQMFKRHLSEGSDKDKIVYLRDYGGIHDQFSKILLNSLVDAVADLKQKGHRVIMIASHCQRTRKLDPDYPDILNMRRISVLPSLQDENQLSEWALLMKQDESRRIREINAKQLLAMYSHKNPQKLKTENQGDLLNDLLAMDGISKAIWPSSDVDRRVTAAIGHALQHNKSGLDLQDFEAANQIVEQCAYMSEKSSTTLSTLTGESLKLRQDGSIDLAHLGKQCNEFERKLLARVVDGTQVQGSFQDVRAPPQTINTLQSLISLPLLRPELFRKGILKKNFIPGVLLFGPPGTGKTMLAKAVAKDSGSRMLDIQASDVYEMYVGQGEKNVKAVFSLARKLSPCVIFIDEVDSLLNQRGSDQAARSHREIINQFMVEWDGLSSLNQGVIVMAATNRPFDLDDAVLRRMPRRILVDLPNEKDRAEILKILLKEEDHQVPIDELAKITRQYSGSDLKNLCVTAALKAVQEQAKTDAFQALTMDHFTEALKMVPASSNDEMGSLVELKKWDAKYGDGKKNKKTSIGFS
ncbi:P-loop containing nucleoside triphosphate hydrolase protein [Parasitella parasitica]|nr:P-loop containing nucleoside triphosphate hydrolase protein [Parasitella parasitica]